MYGRDACCRIDARKFIAAHLHVRMGGNNDDYGKKGVLHYLFFAGGRSVQLPWATSAAMPRVSPSVGCGWIV